MTVDNVSVTGSTGDTIQFRGAHQQGYYNFAEIRDGGSHRVHIDMTQASSDFFNANTLPLRHTSQATLDGVRVTGGSSSETAGNENTGFRYPAWRTMAGSPTVSGQQVSIPNGGGIRLDP